MEKKFFHLRNSQALYENINFATFLKLIIFEQMTFNMFESNI